MLPSDSTLYDESEFVLPYLDSLEQLSCPEGQYNEVRGGVPQVVGVVQGFVMVGDK